MSNEGLNKSQSALVGDSDSDLGVGEWICDGLAIFQNSPGTLSLTADKLIFTPKQSAATAGAHHTIGDTISADNQRTWSITDIESDHVSTAKAVIVITFRRNAPGEKRCDRFGIVKKATFQMATLSDLVAFRKALLMRLLSLQREERLDKGDSEKELLGKNEMVVPTDMPPLTQRSLVNCDLCSEDTGDSQVALELLTLTESMRNCNHLEEKIKTASAANCSMAIKKGDEHTPGKPSEVVATSSGIFRKPVCNRTAEVPEQTERT